MQMILEFSIQPQALLSTPELSYNKMTMSRWVKIGRWQPTLQLSTIFIIAAAQLVNSPNIRLYMNVKYIYSTFMCVTYTSITGFTISKTPI